MRNLAAVAAVWGVIMLTGCTMSTTLTDPMLSMNLQPEKASDKDIEEAYGRKPSVKFPMHIAVYGVGDMALNQQDIDAWREELGHSPFATQVTFLPDMMAGSHAGADSYGYHRERSHEKTREFLKDIRLGAARSHADSVFVYEVQSSTGSHKNILSIFYLTIVGMAVIPGDVYEAQAVARGALVDARTGYVYFVAESRDLKSYAMPSAMGDYSGVRKDAERAAVLELRRKAMEEMKRVAAGRNKGRRS